MIYLENDADIGRNGKSFSIGQGEQFVVVEDGVQILHPFGIHVSIEHDPLTLFQFASHIVDDSEIVLYNQR